MSKRELFSHRLRRCAWTEFLGGLAGKPGSESMTRASEYRREVGSSLGERLVGLLRCCRAGLAFVVGRRL